MPNTVVAGSVIPAVLVSGIDSDLPGPILAQVSENVFDSASGRSLLIPQGSRLIGTSSSASTPGQQRVQISWRRLIFPNTASMDLPQMPGTDQGGYAGFSDQVNNHYLATFSTAAVTSLISARARWSDRWRRSGGGGTSGPCMATTNPTNGRWRARPRGRRLPRRWALWANRDSVTGWIDHRRSRSGRAINST